MGLVPRHRKPPHNGTMAQIEGVIPHTNETSDTPLAALNLPGAFGVHLPPFRIPKVMYKESRERLVQRFINDVPEGPGKQAVLLFKGR